MRDDVRAMLDAAHALSQAGKPGEALLAYRQAAGHARTEGDDEGLATALRYVADLSRETGEPAESLIHAEEAVGLYRRLGEDRALDIAQALRLGALALEALGRDGTAHWREAQPLFEHGGDAAGAADCAAHLAD